MDPQHPLLGAGGRDWALRQLTNAGYEGTDAFHIVRKVLDTLMPYVEADPQTVGDTMPVLSVLLTGKPLPEELWEAKRRATRLWDWKPIMPRTLHPGDVVRVRPDAYPTGPRSLVNGREGAVSALRGGIVVNYFDSAGKPVRGMGDRHPVDKLERRVPAQHVGNEA